MGWPGGFRVLRHRDRVAGPWANGGGITYEVMRWPADGPDFDWRLSIAEIAREGPFSTYPGVDRILILLRGAMNLVIDGTGYDVPLFEPLAFPGEARVESVLADGPTMDFNIMTRRGRVTARADVLTEPAVTLAATPEDPVAVLVLDGERAFDAEDEPLRAWDAVVALRPIDLHGHGTVACVALRSGGLGSENRQR